MDHQKVAYRDTASDDPGDSVALGAPVGRNPSQNHLVGKGSVEPGLERRERRWIQA